MIEAAVESHEDVTYGRTSSLKNRAVPFVGGIITWLFWPVAVIQLLDGVQLIKLELPSTR